MASHGLLQETKTPETFRVGGLTNFERPLVGTPLCPRPGTSTQFFPSRSFVVIENGIFGEEGLWIELVVLAGCFLERISGLP